MAAFTIRLDDGADAQVRFVAGVEERPLNDLIAEAVSRYCLARLADPAFRDDARKHISRQQLILNNTRTDAPGGGK